MTKKYILFIDDTGSRDPDKNTGALDDRKDGMDCFALGGVLIKEEDIDEIYQKHRQFCSEWNIDYPLHSACIRGGRKKFAWLKKPENAGLFFPALQQFLLSLPIIGIACVIDRQGYLNRYKDKYTDQLWYMCKTSFCILVERSAKFADQNGRKLEIFFEQAGKKEDRDIKRYIRELKQQGNVFDNASSGTYSPFTASDYKRIVLGEPRERTKKVPMIQIADLILYPIAKGGYQPEYPPYKALIAENKLIDCLIDEKDISTSGIKYSCFDDRKTKGSDNA